MRSAFRLAAASLVLVVALAAAGTAATRRSALVPKPAVPNAEPKPGEELTAGGDITFRVKDELGKDLRGQVYLVVSASEAKDGNGTLARGKLPAPGRLPALKTFVRKMSYGKDENGKRGYLYTLKREDYGSIAGYWANTAGRYYWQPFVVNCRVEQDSKGRSSSKDCLIEGRTNAFKVPGATTAPSSGQ